MEPQVALVSPEVQGTIMVLNVLERDTAGFEEIQEALG